uniref:Ig-like domain-containing protein n=1 Tax=Anas platyrhynchos platyrhynchos TaxID=8840 RepID=A0A493TVM7_ANAPP
DTLAAPSGALWSVNLGDNVEITCSGGSYGYYAWHQQKTPGTGPVTVIYDNTNRPSDIPSRFSGSLSGYTATLTITGVQAEDEAVYFCVSSLSCPSALGRCLELGWAQFIIVRAQSLLHHLWYSASPFLAGVLVRLWSSCKVL